MVIQVFIPIVERIGLKLQAILGQSWGWVLSAGAFLLSFMAPVKYAFVAMGVSVAADLLFCDGVCLETAEVYAVADRTGYTG